MALLDLILLINIDNTLHGPDLCKSAKMDKWVDGDFLWIITFVLILLDSIYRYIMLLIKCSNTIDINNKCCRVLWSWYLLPILLISGGNIYVSLYYKCKII